MLAIWGVASLNNMLRSGALIIMMNDLVSTRTALTEHHGTAHSAEQLGGEPVSYTHLDVYKRQMQISVNTSGT